MKILFSAGIILRILKRSSITELKVIDTYWSDHCRHTTFSTEITDVTFDNEPVSQKYRDLSIIP